MIIAVLIVAAALLLGSWPHRIHGVVADAGGLGAGAIVRLRGSLDSTTTDAEGHFTLSFRGPALHRVVTAWKEGYYPAGADLSARPAPSASASLPRPGDEGIGLTLKPYPTADDPSYQWLTSNPDPNIALGCGHCMVAYDEWKTDAHALSATNPRFLSFYNGASLSGQAVAEPGFRLDSPQDPGNCANCHAPAAALAHDGSADVNQLAGVEAEGIFCDLCHKIDDVALDAATGLPHQNAAGIASYRLHRPAAGTQVFFGTLDDIPRRVSYSALEKESRFCAPCHSGGWWGVSAYASYDEWLASPYAAEGVTCQACHMPPSGGTSTLTSPCAPATSDDLPGSGDFEDLLCRIGACVGCHRKPADDAARNPLPDFTLIADRPAGTVHTHRMTGVTDEAFMRASVAMTLTAVQGPDGVSVEVAITNMAAGHHIPTDSPLRNMILVVTGSDASGNELPYLGEQVVPAWGGEGAVSAQNYAGQPGKGFAKILEDYEGNAPAPQWRNGIHVLSDNRIAARATDRSVYTFAAPADGRPAVVAARLIFRRAFKPWMDAKGWNEPDFILAEAETSAILGTAPVLTSTTTISAPLSPSSPATTIDGQRLRSADFVTPQECAGCHTSAALGWQASGHAAATTGPLYRAWFKAADQTTQGQIGPYCAGCHTPVGLLSGQIRSRWVWSGRELYPLDEAARGGVTCDVCHSIVGTTGAANGAYILDPTRRPVGDVKSTCTRAVTATLAQRDSSVCAPCHEATNPGSGVTVMSTYSEWQRSPFNTGDPSTTTTCLQCHFADGRHGGLRREDLQKAARVEILPAAEPTPGDKVELQVRVTNVGAGHDLPTGVAELRRVWLEVTVTDATGRTVFTSGTTDAYGDPNAGSVAYGVVWLDSGGNPTDRLWEAERTNRDYRITAGGSRVETYRLALPAEVAGPLHVHATLNYRRVSGYLSSLMSIYLGETALADAAIVLSAAESEIAVR